MRKLIVNTFLSLDGVMQAPGGPGEDPSGGFELEGWSVNYWDDKMGERMGEFMGRPFDLLLGRTTYEIFVGHWPKVKDDPAADALNSAKKYVASKTLKSVDWNNSELLEGDVPSAVKKLKEADGPEIQVHGSSNLLQTLIANDLIDQYQLWFFPVVLGQGKRLFEEGTTPLGFKLVDSQSFSKGVIVGLFERAGDVQTGTFALPEDS